MADQTLQSSQSLQNLFASLKPASARTQSSDAPAHPPSYPDTPQSRQPSTFSQSFESPSRVPASNAFSGAPSPAPSSRQVNADLLNYLRNTSTSSTPVYQPSTQPYISGERGPSTSQQPPVVTQNIHGRGVSSSDLVASFMGKPAVSSSPATPPAMSESQGSINTRTHPQDYLLQLLNRSVSSPSKPLNQNAFSKNGSLDTEQVNQVVGTPISQESASKPNRPASRTTTARRESPIRQFGTSESKETTPFEPELPPGVAQAHADRSRETTPFTYRNPFEQLAASSPLQQRSGNATPEKNNSKSYFSASRGSQAPGTNTNLTFSALDVLRSIEQSSPSPPPSKAVKLEPGSVESLMGVGAPTTDTETVAQALNDVGEQVNRQVEHALSQQETDEVIKEPENEEAVAEVEKTLQEAAAEIKDELKENGDIDTLKSLLPDDMAEEVKEIIEEAADGNVDGHYESADDEKSSARGEEDSVQVPVYNFPLKPFVALSLQQDVLSPLQFRDGSITDIARLRKDFDQIDRTLATASNNYIVYAMPKPGGYRVISQDDGYDVQLFKETKDHIFNVSISTTAPGKLPEHETCIATAVSGKVYWTNIRDVSDDDLISKPRLEQHCLVFPPMPAHDDNTSGGKLKTRAKKSSRHPGFFAIGRGKSIQVIFPFHALKSTFVSNDRVVDTAGYFKNRSLKINMGKAGKDFAFSEDDTVIATLDKAGRLRLWDINDLIDDSNGVASALAPIEVKTPVLTFHTSLANEKSWPTSVLFVDKIRAYTNGTALRYVIVGLKQNHTLQLWDLGLGKAVQEINFPHEKESDPICSVSYHPGSGIVVIGHPTRNSIYFIHLSAPRYNLKGMSQARYVQRLAIKDSSLPTPDSTAIMSGMREYSFASKGQLRSIDLVPASSGSPVEKTDSDLFELYAMHSRGVTCLNITKADLGWSEEMKVVSPRNAEAEGMVVIKGLREVLGPALSEPSSVNGDALSSSTVKPKKKNSEATPAKQNGADSYTRLDPSAPIESALNGATTAPAPDKAEKRRKKKVTSAAEESIPPPAPAPPGAGSLSTTTTLSRANSFQPKDTSKSHHESKSKREMSSSQQISLGVSSDFMDRELKKLRDGVSEEFSTQFNALMSRIHDDKVILDAASNAKQEELLRLVSSSLTENVEKTLTRIVTTSISQTVVPSINGTTTATLRKEVPEWLSKHLLATLPAQIKLTLPEAVGKVMQSKDVQNFMSDQIVNRISSHVEKQISNNLHNSVLPTFQKLVLDSMSKKLREAESNVNEQIRLANVVHAEDTAKIDQLTKLVQACTETIHSMAASQAQFQAEILKTHKEILQIRPRQESELYQLEGSAPGAAAARKASVTPVHQEEVSQVTPKAKSQASTPIGAHLVHRGASSNVGIQPAQQQAAPRLNAQSGHHGASPYGTPQISRSGSTYASFQTSAQATPAGTRSSSVAFPTGAPASIMPTTPSFPEVGPTPEQREVANINNAMINGNYEQGTIIVSRGYVDRNL